VQKYGWLPELNENRFGQSTLTIANKPAHAIGVVEQ
jgi:hypothetical protein